MVLSDPKPGVTGTLLGKTFLVQSECEFRGKLFCFQNLLLASEFLLSKGDEENGNRIKKLLLRKMGIYVA